MWMIALSMALAEEPRELPDPPRIARLEQQEARYGVLARARRPSLRATPLYFGAVAAGTLAVPGALLAALSRHPAAIAAEFGLIAGGAGLYGASWLLAGESAGRLFRENHGAGVAPLLLCTGTGIALAVSGYRGLMWTGFALLALAPPVQLLVNAGVLQGHRARMRVLPVASTGPGLSLHARW